ncbi:MAG: DUF4229 domain-containing protein [Clostridiales bacterium]|nr:DUF4229 domain-containing protein [Clostridiales bacterium]
MKLLQWFNKKKSRKQREFIEQNQIDQESLSEPIYRMDDKEDRKLFTEDACVQIIDASKEIEDAKVEYQAVNNYLTDIQAIDMVPEDEKKELVLAGEKIVELNAERKVYQKEPSKLSDAQYLHLESNEDTLGEIMKKMDEDEKYCQLIKNDMDALEGEKGALKYERSDYQSKIKGFYGASRLMISIFGVLLLFFILLGVVREMDVEIPIYFTLVIAAIVATVIFFNYRRTLYNLKLAERKLNKAISMLNRIKIRYVNMKNSLEYQYSKHSVHSAYELNHIWEIYEGVKRERKKYEYSSRELHEAEMELIDILEDYQIKDSHVWTLQAIAIVDNREMVETRHELNERRKIIRDRIDYNMKVIENTKGKVQDFIHKKPEYAKEILDIVNRYSIEIN